VAGPDGVDRVLDLGAITGSATPAQLLADDAALAAARAAIGRAEPANLPRLDDVRLAPPVRPRTILCLSSRQAPPPGRRRHRPRTCRSPTGTP
jgi:hypothetical protein